MIRVGFIVTTGKWLGGINYLRNLLYAISTLNTRDIEPVVFLGTRGTAQQSEDFAKYAKVIRTSLLDRYSPGWSLWKAFDVLGQGSLVIEPFLLKHGIETLSHSGQVGFKKIKSVNWVPDFQQRHLPGMFSAKEIAAWNKWCRTMLEKSDHIILSSHAAMKDAVAFVPNAASRLSVLRFVAQLDRRIFQIKAEDVDQIRQKYHLPEKFCYLPNQFWKHKNHLLVFQAIDRLKREGFEIKIVCSGPMEDCRNPGHTATLKKFIAEHQLQENISLLGQIPFNDVGLLYAACSLVINPSLFEGWSTSVEEAKSMGKRIVLSDIPVHREQAPARGIYFDPYNPQELAGKLKETLAGEDRDTFLSHAKDLQEDLNQRTKLFAESFQNVVSGMSK